MGYDGSVLILGEFEGFEGRRSELTSRVRAVGHSALTAKTPQDAIAAAEERGARIRCALFEPSMPAFDLTAAIDALRHHPCTDRFAAIACGDPPDDDTIARLRAAGVERSLWEPFCDHALRFELNRAFADPQQLADRRERRVATGWATRIFVAGRRKPGAIYTISPGGAFVETPRPQLRGARLALELPLPDGGAPLSLAGTVVYTNVPGNLQKTNLPTGMAVRFEGAGQGQLERVRDAVENAARQFELELG